MGRWLNALRQAEKNPKTLEDATDKTDKTLSGEVLSVLSVPSPAVYAKFSDQRSVPVSPDSEASDAPTGLCSELRVRLAALDPNRPPPNFSAPWWRGIVRDAELFLSVWGKPAADLGWTTLDLFGAHRKAPTANFSCMGLLLVIRGGRVVVLTTEAAKIEQQSGARLTYTRRPPDAECVAVWDLRA
jgi:hypothetical protein